MCTQKCNDKKNIIIAIIKLIFVNKKEPLESVVMGIVSNPFLKLISISMAPFTTNAAGKTDYPHAKNKVGILLNTTYNN